jgi:two-component system OmpR family response regulator
MNAAHFFVTMLLQTCTDTYDILMRMNTDTQHILVVDDDIEICQLLTDYLSKHGYRVSTANNGSQMHKQLDKHSIDLITLDVMMPGDDGLTLCKQVIQTHSLPILILSAQGDAADRIVGLEVGADDYLAKPFNPRELLARIKALLRHQQKAQFNHQQANNLPLLQFDQWRVDQNRRALINQKNVHIALTQGEYKLLIVLLNHANHVLSRNQLLELTHGRESGPYDRTIDVQIGRLRKKIEIDPKKPAIIKTIRGGGYQLCSQVNLRDHHD